jgi:hypothetical protein
MTPDSVYGLSPSGSTTNASDRLQKRADEIAVHNQPRKVQPHEVQLEDLYVPLDDTTAATIAEAAQPCVQGARSG